MRPISGFGICATRLRIYAMRALRCSTLLPDLDPLDAAYLDDDLQRPL